MKTRICTICGKEFEVTAKDTMRRCRQCNLDRVQRQPKEAKLVNSAQQRAKRKGLAFNITKEDIYIPDYCPILGIPLYTRHGVCGGGDNSPTVDRIDNSLGYVKGNVHVISNLANRMKFTASPELMLKFADWVYKEFKPERK